MCIGFGCVGRKEKRYLRLETQTKRETKFKWCVRKQKTITATKCAYSFSVVRTVVRAAASQAVLRSIPPSPTHSPKKTVHYAKPLKRALCATPPTHLHTRRSSARGKYLYT